MNFSVGSCFPYEGTGAPGLNETEAAFLKRVFRLATVTTVRDRVAQEVSKQIGEAPELVPDTGFLAGFHFRRAATLSTDPDVIAINYQERGANEDWGQGVDKEAWARTVRELITSLKRRHKVVFVCHGAVEEKLAEALDASVPRFAPKTGDEYARFFPRVKAAVCNRLHAAIGMSGCGIPVIAVGTDTRLKTLEEVGLPTYYVKTISAGELELKLEELVARRATEHDRLIHRHTDTMNRYVDLLRKAAAEAL